MSPGDLVRLKEGTMLYPLHSGDADIIQVDLELPEAQLATIIATKRGWNLVWTYDCLWHVKDEHLASVG